MKRLVWLLLLSLASGQEIRRPSSDIDPGGLSSIGCTTAGHQNSVAMPKAYDGPGLTTSAFLQVAGDDTKAHSKTRSFLTWQSTTNVYSALTLNINASFDSEEPEQACIKYSTDNGISYTTIKCDAGVPIPFTTYTVTLTPTLDLSKLRVSACVFGGQGNTHAEIPPGFGDIQIADIWTAGTTAAQPAGTGPGTGQPHRGAVVSN